MQDERKKQLKKLYFKTLGITLAVCFAVIGAGMGVLHYYLGDIVRTYVDESKLSANESEGGIINLAFFGIDSESTQGRSDAILVVSVDVKDATVKMVSIARDTYVTIPDYGNTKINHAYAYGGPELAIRTLNENFHLDITDYVAVNFDQLADVIDAFGGIDLEITEAERVQINAYLLSGEPLRTSGYVHLNGPQAVSYARIRKIDNDNGRTERQRKVLTCLFEKITQISPTQYPSYVKQFAPLVETSLGNDEILAIGAIGLKSNIRLEQGAFPNEYIQYQGGSFYGAWYYMYDIEQAADMLHQFIYEDIPFSEYGKEPEAEEGQTEEDAQTASNND